MLHGSTNVISTEYEEIYICEYKDAKTKYTSMGSVYCPVPVHVCLLTSVWLSTGVILQARCVVAVRQAVRPAGETPLTVWAVKNLSSYTSTSVWWSVLQRTLSGMGSASTAPQPVRSAAHLGSAQVLKHNANQDSAVQSLLSLIHNVLLPLYGPLWMALLLPACWVLFLATPAVWLKGWQCCSVGPSATLIWTEIWNISAMDFFMSWFPYNAL